jgi:RNA polymerase sigma factor (sigma-70 family)
LRQPDGEIQALLTQLRSGAPHSAWSVFLTSYSGLIYGVVHIFAHEQDHIADCFVFVCEKLAERSYRRILSFRPDGRARFTTWLRAVVRNLCLDWHRSQFGRKQVFAAVAGRSGVDQEIFRAAFHRKETIAQICTHLSKNGCELSYSDVETRVEDLRASMTARQLWLLSTGRHSLEFLDSHGPALEIADTSPDPETLSLMRDTKLAVVRAFAQLNSRDRLLLRLRFAESLSFVEVARLLGLKDAQTADRRIRDVLERLREKLGVYDVLVGKRKSASV